MEEGAVLICCGRFGREVFCGEGETGKRATQGESGRGRRGVRKERKGANKRRDDTETQREVSGETREGRENERFPRCREGENERREQEMQDRYDARAQTLQTKHKPSFGSSRKIRCPLYDHTCQSAMRHCGRARREQETGWMMQGMHSTGC